VVGACLWEEAVVVGLVVKANPSSTVLVALEIPVRVWSQPLVASEFEYCFVF